MKFFCLIFYSLILINAQGHSDDDTLLFRQIKIQKKNYDKLTDIDFILQYKKVTLLNEDTTVEIFPAYSYFAGAPKETAFLNLITKSLSESFYVFNHLPHPPKVTVNILDHEDKLNAFTYSQGKIDLFVDWKFYSPHFYRALMYHETGHLLFESSIKLEDDLEGLERTLKFSPPTINKLLQIYGALHEFFADFCLVLLEQDRRAPSMLAHHIDSYPYRQKQFRKFSDDLRKKERQKRFELPVEALKMARSFDDRDRPNLKVLAEAATYYNENYEDSIEFLYSSTKELRVAVYNLLIIDHLQLPSQTKIDLLLLSLQQGLHKLINVENESAINSEALTHFNAFFIAEIQSSLAELKNKETP